MNVSWSSIRSRKGSECHRDWILGSGSDRATSSAISSYCQSLLVKILGRYDIAATLPSNILFDQKFCYQFSDPRKLDVRSKIEDREAGIKLITMQTM